MALVSVKTVEGRVAFADTKNQRKIPTDRFISVPLNTHVKRLITVHKDVIVEPSKAAPSSAPTKPVIAKVGA